MKREEEEEHKQHEYYLEQTNARESTNHITHEAHREIRIQA
jgi:hypothetical protein